VAALRAWTDVRAADASLGAPAAWLATGPHVPGLEAALRGGAPVAVVVDDASRLPPVVHERATVLVTRDAATADALADARTLLVGRDRIRASAHRPLTPFLRSRWRRRLGLADPMVVRVGTADHWPERADDVVPALAVAGAAAVVGPRLVTALALGTPVVTTEAEAARVGATAGVHLAVATPSAMSATATTLAADWPRAAAIGWGGRVLVETRLDLDASAREIVDALGIGPTGLPSAPLAELDAALAGLGTPVGAAPARRALRRASGVAGTGDWTTLTGRRQ
jgi:hypothetical protein